MLQTLNFLDDEFAEIFKDIPIFIYHGIRDRNCPYEITQEFAEKIAELNHNILFIVDEEAGHGTMSAENRKIYHQWLLNVL